MRVAVYISRASMAISSRPDTYSNLAARTTRARRRSRHAMKRVAVGSTNPVKIGAVRAVMTSRLARRECRGRCRRIDGERSTASVTTRRFAARSPERLRRATRSAPRLVSASKAAWWSTPTAVCARARGRRSSMRAGSKAWAARSRCSCRRASRGSFARARSSVTRWIGWSARTTPNTAQGAVGILTDGMVDRQRAYEVLVMYALAPFVTPTLYER